MNRDARRVSDELRHKHIRTLEVLRQLVDENNAMRKKLNLLRASDEWDKETEVSEGSDMLQEQMGCLQKKLQSVTEASARANLKVDQLTAELRQARSETETARVAEKATELTLVELQARNNELKKESAQTQEVHAERAKQLEIDVVELREQLESTIDEAQEVQARAKLDVSRLESEVEELRHSTSQASLSRLESPWTEDFDDDEASVSQREVDVLERSLRKATRSASTAKRRCSEWQRQARDEVRRREIVERELHAIQATMPKASWQPVELGRGPRFEMMPLAKTPHRQGRLNGGDITRKGTRNGHPGGQLVPSAKTPENSGLSTEKRPPFPPQQSGGNGCEEGSPSSSIHSSIRSTTTAGKEGFGSGMRRLRESERTLRESNIKLQREVNLHQKRLEKAENFACKLEAEIQRVAGKGANFESFVVLRRENQTLKTQLAEIKQAHAMLLASSPSKTVNISFSESSRRQGGGNYGGRGVVAAGGSKQRLSLTSLPRQRSPSSATTGRGTTAPLRATCVSTRGGPAWAPSAESSKK